MPTLNRQTCRELFFGHAQKRAAQRVERGNSFGESVRPFWVWNIVKKVLFLLFSPFSFFIFLFFVFQINQRPDEDVCAGWTSHSSDRQVCNRSVVPWRNISSAVLNTNKGYFAVCIITMVICYWQFITPLPIFTCVHIFTYLCTPELTWKKTPVLYCTHSPYHGQTRICASFLRQFSAPVFCFSFQSIPLPWANKNLRQFSVAHDI